MKTAKELANQAKPFMKGFEYDYYFSKEEFEMFCNQLCKEQREICSEQVKDKWIKNAVKTASEPELK